MDAKLKDELHSAFDYAMSQIDFKKIEAVMHLTGWTWCGEVDYVTERMLKATTFDLFECCLDLPEYLMLRQSSIGGMCVSIIKWSDESTEVQISFKMESFSATVGL
jgi:hypothetical protein